jgi:PAS domain S-box-containing protein
VVLSDLDGRVTYANDSWIQLFGYARSREVVGRHASEFAESPEEADRVVAAILAEGKWTGEASARKKNGERFFIEISGGVLRNPHGTPLGSGALTAGISEPIGLDAISLIGLYGLIAYVVRLRTHEIGIRLALGATREKVFFELFRQGAQLVFAGVVVGVATAIALRGIASTFVFGVTTADPLTYLIAALAFSGAALAAVIMPARRASRVQPINALRFE